MLLCNPTILRPSAEVLHYGHGRPVAARQRQPLLVVQSAASAGAGGINDDNKERVVKGNVGDPSKAQPTVKVLTVHPAALLS